MLCDVNIQPLFLSTSVNLVTKSPTLEVVQFESLNIGIRVSLLNFNLSSSNCWLFDLEQVS